MEAAFKMVFRQALRDLIDSLLCFSVSDCRCGAASQGGARTADESISSQLEVFTTERTCGWGHHCQVVTVTLLDYIEILSVQLT